MKSSVKAQTALLPSPCPVLANAELGTENPQKQTGGMPTAPRQGCSRRPGPDGEDVRQLFAHAHLGDDATAELSPITPQSR